MRRRIRLGKCGLPSHHHRRLRFQSEQRRRQRLRIGHNIREALQQFRSRVGAASRLQTLFQFQITIPYPALNQTLIPQDRVHLRLDTSNLRQPDLVNLPRRQIRVGEVAEKMSISRFTLRESPNPRVTGGVRPLPAQQCHCVLKSRIHRRLDNPGRLLHHPGANGRLLVIQFRQALRQRRHQKIALGSGFEETLHLPDRRVDDEVRQQHVPGFPTFHPGDRLAYDGFDAAQTGHVVFSIAQVSNRVG